MNAGRYVGASVPVQGPLAGLVEGFDVWLFGRGYSVRTVDTQMRMVRDLSLWLDRRGLAVSALDGALVESYAADRRSRTRALRSARGLVPLLDFFREVGAADVVCGPQAPQPVLLDFAVHLNDRGLAAETARSYCSQVAPLTAAVDGDWARLTLERVRCFIDEHAAVDSPRSVQVRINATRSLLRWLWQRRQLVMPLHEQVLSMYAPSGPPLPRGLTAAEVAAVRAALSADPLTRLRDEALITLLVRLGLRAGEAAGLLLDDVDWRAGTLTVRGKRARVDVLPVPVDVGEALVAYLRRGRPEGTGHRQMFLAVDAPHGPIGPAAVGGLVSGAMRRAGIESGAAHRLRHTAAMNVIASGGGLVEAGQLLRHSSVAATAIYARADVAGLAVLARPWPGASA